MEIHPILTLLIGLAALFLTGFGLWYKIDRDTNTKIDAIKKDSDEQISAIRKESREQIAELSKLFATNLAEAQKQGDEKRARIYERLDTTKTAHREEISALRKEVYDSFVGVKWCSLIHATSDKVFTKFEQALAALGEKLDTLLARG